MAKLRMMAPALRSMETRSISVARKAAEPFYLSPAWRALMVSIIAKRGRRCEDPHCDGRTHKPGMRVFGDHIIELRDGGAPLDPSNVMLRCGASHTRKTLAARGVRMAEKF